MNKIRIFFAALVAVCMVSCIGFKTEATVDVTVVKDSQPQKGVQVYRFENNGQGESSAMYKSNAKDVQTTNDKGVAHFDLKSPDDLDPSSVGLVESKVFYFATFDKDDHRNGLTEVSVTSGDKKQVTLVIEENKDGEQLD